MPPQFKKHSTQIGHQPACKCTQCREARAWSRKLERSGYRAKTDATEAVNKIRFMYQQSGHDLEGLSRFTGIPYGALNTLVHRHAPATMDPERVSHIMSLNFEDMELKSYPRDKYLWRVHVLAAQGFALKRLSEMAGMNLRITLDRDRSHERVAAAKWHALDRVWVQVGDRMATTESDGFPPVELAKLKTHCRRMGYYPRAAYDNDYDLKPADTASGYHAIIQDRRELQLLVERRVRAGMLRNEIRDELQGIYPDVISWEHLVDSAQTQVRRENAQLK